MIGAGSWGTALTWLLTNNGHQVTVWSALADEITMLQEKHEPVSYTHLTLPTTPYV